MDAVEQYDPFSVEKIWSAGSDGFHLAVDDVQGLFASSLSDGRN